MIVSLKVLNGDHGRPVADLPVRFEQLGSAGWEPLATRRTTADGQVPDLPVRPEVGVRYRCILDTDWYFTALGVASFYSGIPVVLHDATAGSTQRVTILLTPNSYFVHHTHV